MSILSKEQGFFNLPKCIKRHGSTPVRQSLSLLLVPMLIVASLISPVAAALPSNYNWQRAGTIGLSGDNSTWQSVASSADGTKLIATDGGLAYTSTDSGANWVERSVAVSYVSSSADGTKLAGAGNGGYIYTSSDSGATWTQQTSAGNRSWWQIACSSDCSRLVALDAYGSDYSGGYIYVSDDFGVTWTEQVSAGKHIWYHVAVSADGSTIAATTGDYYNSGNIITSTDSGSTWGVQSSVGIKYWTSITSSSDGTKLAAVVDNSSIYTSSDSGVTWTEQTTAGSRAWTSITSSSDGTKLAAVADSDSVYTSSDSGVTWTEQTTAGSRVWTSITSSSDGTKLAAVADSDSVYTSSDSGVTWTERVAAGSRQWKSIASSSNGTKVAAVDYYGAGSGGSIYTSSDSATSWVERTVAGERTWTSIASSADGADLAATANNGYIYTSSDSGVTWAERTSVGSRGWTSVAISSDGQKLVAVETSVDPDTSEFGGYIYTSNDNGATWVTRTAAGSHPWHAVIASSDGTRLMVIDSIGIDGRGGYLYTSSDFGATWTVHTAELAREWASIASSADGTKLFGATLNRFIYKGSITTPAGSFFDYATISSSQDSTVANAVLSVTSNSCYSIDYGNVALMDVSGVVAPKSTISIVGGISYNLSCITQGGTANATIVLGAYYSDLSVLHIYKKSTASGLQDITSQIRLTNTYDSEGAPITVLDYALVDGGIYDEDGVANGTIVDPVYIGLESGVTQDSPATNTLANTGSDWWGLGFTSAAMIVASGILFTRRSHKALYK